MTLFLPTVVVLADLLESERPRRAPLVLLALLLFGCAGAKASILPVLIGGLVVYALWTRRLDSRLAAGLCLALVAFVASYALLYGGGRGGTNFNPLESSFLSLPGQQLAGVRTGGGIKGALAWPIATWVTAVALMAALAGLAWARLQQLLISLLVASVVAFFALDLSGYSQLYFLWYGFTAGALLSAGGLVEAARGRHRVRGWPLALAAGVAIGVVLALGAPADAPGLLRLYMAAAALLGAAVVAYALLRHRLPAWPAVVAVSALLAAGLVDGPADRLPDIASRIAGNEPVHREADPQRERGLPRSLSEGLAWVRDNTAEDAVLAVNNHIRRPADGDSRYFYYSALAERRIFVESWEYADAVFGISLEDVRAGRHPFAKRVALNDDVYTGANSAAAALKRRGVDYLLVDRVNAPPPRNRIPGRVVFRNSALVVYRL
jgi:hypothetical protein